MEFVRCGHESNKGFIFFPHAEKIWMSMHALFVPLIFYKTSALIEEQLYLRIDIQLRLISNIDND